MKKTNFTPSKHHVADFKFGKISQKGGGGVVMQNKLREPVLFPDYLPENKIAQRPFKLKKIDPDLKKFLSNSAISDDLKLKLYNMFQSKYSERESDQGLESNASKNWDFTGESDLAGENDLNLAGSRKILNKFVAALPKVLKKRGEILADILMKEKKYIQWDRDGEIIVPQLTDIGAYNLNTLIRAVLYRKGILYDHSEITAKIIRPFYDKLQERELIGNEALFKRIMKKLKKVTRQTDDISW